MAVKTTTCGTCGTVTIGETFDGDFTEVYVWKCEGCLADEARTDDVLFEAMLSLEQTIRGEDAGSVYSDQGRGHRELCAKRRDAAKAELYGIVCQLRPDQLKAFGEYRAAQLA